MATDRTGSPIIGMTMSMTTIATIAIERVATGWCPEMA
jgi:hypothetical protein